MNNKKSLVRPPSFEPTVSSSPEVVEKLVPASKTLKKAKNKLDASVAVSKQTRSALNAMRKVKKVASVDDLINDMLEREAALLKDTDRTIYEAFKKL